ncbi:MAG: response regulator transcription factor [Acidimicrobiales bacterium]
MPAIRLVVVDDHEIVRAGLSALLAADPEIHVVATASDGPTALAAISEIRPDIAVVDYSMPGMTGLELCSELASRCPGVAVIILTTFLSDEVVSGAIEAGAKAFVSKDVDASDLKRAIRSVARGESVLDPKVAGRVADWAHRWRRGPLDHPLTARETDVLRLVAVGSTNRQIAERLVLSENTVRTYLKRLLFKLECHTRSEAAAVASRRGLL